MLTKLLVIDVADAFIEQKFPRRSKEVLGKKCDLITSSKGDEFELWRMRFDQRFDIKDRASDIRSNKALLPHNLDGILLLVEDYKEEIESAKKRLEFAREIFGKLRVVTFVISHDGKFREDSSELDGIHLHSTISDCQKALELFT